MDTIQSPSQPSGGGSGNNQKKELLQKLMSNLLNKPGRSMHELINGVKAAIGAYKNYAKEWDSLNGMSTEASTGAPSQPVMGANRGSIKSILDQIQQKKAGAPAMPSPSTPAPQAQPPANIPLPPSGSAMPPMPPQGSAPMPQPPMIAGPEQKSEFNRPPPVSNLGIHGF